MVARAQLVDDATIVAPWQHQAQRLTNEGHGNSVGAWRHGRHASAQVDLHLCQVAAVRVGSWQPGYASYKVHVGRKVDREGVVRW